MDVQWGKQTFCRMLWGFAAVLPVVLVLHITWEAILCLANQPIGRKMEESSSQLLSVVT